MDTRSTTKPRTLRAKLTLRGHTYGSFAKAKGYNQRTVKAAVRGERGGKLCKEIAAAIRKL
jgi:hypothetical protein